MRNVRLTRSRLVTTSQRVVITVLLVGLGLTIGIPSLADAFDRDLRRKFYLTTGTFNGDGTDTRCDSRFHMASLCEIFDTSNLKYDTNRVEGRLRPTPAQDPPAA